MGSPMPDEFVNSLLDTSKRHNIIRDSVCSQYDAPRRTEARREFYEAFRVCPDPSVSGDCGPGCSATYFDVGVVG